MSFLARSACLLAVVACVTPAAARAGEDAFRCGTHLVAVGDARATVRDACGEPTTARVVQTNLPGPAGGWLHVERELWTYDFGPLEFRYALTFSGDQLESIERGDYGR